MERDVLRREANARAAQRDWPGAVAAFEALARSGPDDAAAWIGLSKAHGLAGDYRAAHAAALRAAAAAPTHWPHALALARLLRGLHETRALIALARSLQAHAARASIEQLVELADLLGREDAHAEALEWLALALVRDPRHAPALYLRGTIRLFMGRMDEARNDLETAVSVVRHFAHAHWRLAQLRAHDPDGARARVARLREERDKAVPGSEHDIHFSHALFDELHDLGEHDDAWQALERGMRAKRATLRYHADQDRALFDAIRTRCDAAFLDGPGHRDPGGPQPIFIVGLFRSGTTLMERILAGHPQVAAGGESFDFTTQLRLAANHRGRGALDAELLRACTAIDWPGLGADFLAHASWRAGGRDYWTEKLPSNLLNLGLIARALPHARFVHMRRAPMDVCFSNLRTLYGAFGPYSCDQREMALYHRGYADLMAHWRNVLGARLLDVGHADLVRDPEAETRRVLAHCGLDHVPQLLAFETRGDAVSTASAAQVRAGIHGKARPDWWPYRERLQVLADVLQAGD